MKKAILIIFVVLQSITTFACCAEKDYRLFPIGEVNNEVIFIEFDLFRNCRKGDGIGLSNEFWIVGTINLLKGNSDSLTFIENIDTVQLKECVCTYKNYYEQTENEIFFEKYYRQAIKKVEMNNDFQIVDPKTIIFNDTLNTSVKETSTDTTFSYIINYKNIFRIDIGKLDIISCYPDKVTEVRIYETNNYEITILRLRCYLKNEEEIKHIIKRFENIETAIWKEKAQWHGIAKDYYIIKKKKH